jgi:tetratricopeptide (TPR) repeat protein
MFFKKKCPACGRSNSLLAKSCVSCGAALESERAETRVEKEETPKAGAARPEPESAEAYYEIGLELQKQGKEEQAIDEFNKALRIDPGFVKAYRNRGYAYLNTNQYDLAIADNNKAAKLDPKDPVARLNLGVAHKMQGNKAEAIANFEKVLNLSDNPQVLEMAKQEIKDLSRR